MFVSVSLTIQVPWNIWGRKSQERTASQTFHLRPLCWTQPRVWEKPRITRAKTNWRTGISFPLLPSALLALGVVGLVLAHSFPSLMGTVACRTTPQLLAVPQPQLDMSHRDNALVNKFLLPQLMEVEVRLGMWPGQAEGARSRDANVFSLFPRAHMLRVMKA